MPAAGDGRAGVSLRPLAWTRIALGIVFLIRTTFLMSMVDSAIGANAHPLLGWPRSGQFRAAFMNLSLPPAAIATLCIFRTCAALLFLLGYRPWWSGLVAGVSAYAIVLQDVFSFTFTQHLLFLGIIAVATTDCATALAVRREEVRAPRTSFFVVWTLVTSVYFWAALCKLRRDWFDGRTLGLFYQEGKLRGALADALLGTPSARGFASTSVVVIELLLPVLLWSPKTRWLGLALALGLHLTFEQVARPDVIGWAMIALLLSFVPYSETPVFLRATEDQSGVQVALSNGQTKSP